MVIEHLTPVEGRGVGGGFKRKLKLERKRAIPTTPRDGDDVAVQ